MKTDQTDVFVSLAVSCKTEITSPILVRTSSVGKTGQSFPERIRMTITSVDWQEYWPWEAGSKLGGR